MKKVLVFLSMFTLAAGPVSPAASAVVEPAIKSITVSRDIIKLEGEVSQAMLPVSQQILKQLNEGKKEIWLGINSPGGNTIIEDLISQAIKLAKARGATVKCAVSVLAMSAAFAVLRQCDERYALVGAKLLFHPVKIVVSGGGLFGGSEAFNAKDMRKLAEQLTKMDEAEKKELCRTVGGNREDRCQTINLRYDDEYVWDAEELALFADPHFLTVVQDIRGWDSMLDMGPKKKAPRPEF